MAEGMDGPNSSKLPRYGAVRPLAREFAARLQDPDRQKTAEKYQDVDAGILFLRYYSRFRHRFEEESIEPISARSVALRTSEDNGYKIVRGMKIPTLPYKDTMRIRREVGKIDESYNTEDRQIRWLLDHGLANISLGSFWSLLPKEVKSRMTQWRLMPMETQKAERIYRSLLAVDSSYNTRDGYIRWLTDNGLAGTNIQSFWRVIPMAVRDRMTRWRSINPYYSKFENAVEFFNLNRTVAEDLRQRHGITDPLVTRRIADFLCGRGLNKQQIDTTLDRAANMGKRFIRRLRRERLIMGRRRMFNIGEMHEFYKFAADQYALSSTEVWVILRLNKMNLGMRNPDDRERKEPLGRTRFVSLDATPPMDAGGRTLGERVGSEDPGFARIEARLALEAVAKAGHLNETQLQVLKKVIDGQDIEEEEYKALAAAIKEHPELMELLGIEGEE